MKSMKTYSERNSMAFAHVTVFQRLHCSTPAWKRKWQSKRGELCSSFKLPLRLNAHHELLDMMKA